ncbi:MAG: hypothetical protein ACJ8F0_16335, partial [Xanthobacteraceae bacterium]
PCRSSNALLIFRAEFDQVGGEVGPLCGHDPVAHGIETIALGDYCERLMGEPQFNSLGGTARSRKSCRCADRDLHALSA